MPRNVLILLRVDVYHTNLNAFDRYWKIKIDQKGSNSQVCSNIFLLQIGYRVPNILIDNRPPFGKIYHRDDYNESARLS